MRPAPGDPLTALKHAIARRLERGRCFVSFSGGRDSSLVLAAAVHAAREGGHPPPVPVSLRFPDDPASHEARWQELLIRELRVPDWHVIELHEELDLVGPVAERVLSEAGVLFPANAHFHLPMLEVASGGTLLTGHPGDGLLGMSQWMPLYAVARRARRPGARDVLIAAKAIAPRPLRARHAAWKWEGLPWLRPDAAREVAASLAREQAEEPVSWRRRAPWFAGRRRLELAVSALDAVAAMADAEIAHPLADPGFVSVLAWRGGIRGFASRTALLRELFSSVLPAELVERRTKAAFDGAFKGRRTLEFVESWDGSGVDGDLVDPERLRQHWRSDGANMGSTMLLQQAWLRSRRGSADSAPARVGDRV